MSTSEPQPPTSASLVIVLDSSFNPPTIAHLGMALDAILAEQRREKKDGESSPRLLLLLAVNNADKAAATEEDVSRRLAMMWLFAGDLLGELQAWVDWERASESGKKDLAVVADIGLTSQPYFHAKARAIVASGAYGPQSRTGDVGAGSQPQPQLLFLAGYDTLVRIFNPKYYPAKPGTTSPQPDQALPSHPSSMKSDLDPFFVRSRLRITLRPDDGWGSVAEQREYFASLRDTDALERVGGRREWMDRVELAPLDEGKAAAAGGTGAETGGGEDVPKVSSTNARRAAAEGRVDVLRRILSPAVASWVVEQRMYR